MKWREHKTDSKFKLEYQSKAGLDLIKKLYESVEVIEENIKKNKNK